MTVPTDPPQDPQDPQDPPATDPPEDPQDPPEDPEEGKTFDLEYVKGLRQEAAEHRVKANEATERATALETALRSAVTRQAAVDILADPTDLAWSDDFNGEDGLPDPEKITEAAEALANEKPHLARVRGDAGLGYRGQESDSVSLSELLRAGA